jgi:DNA polymerase I-like protein with 3'-5' exonuclease and polymerase domains/uracil-DNA glycosylase
MKGLECTGCPAQYEPCLQTGYGENPAHIVVVGPAPSGFSIGQQQAFYGRHGRLFKQLLSIIRQYGEGKYAGVKVYFTYATMVGAYEPSAAHISKCRPIFMRQLRSIRGFNDRLPVIVPLGPIAAKAVGVDFRKIVDVIGREYTVNVPDPNGTRRYPVVPLLSMKHLEAKIGTSNIVLTALLKAVAISYGDKDAKIPLEELTKDYVYPKTIEEVEELVDMVLGYYDPDEGTGPEQWAISIDTETNTLKPFSHPDPKVLMLSVAWDDRKAATILLDHPEVPYDPVEAWKHIKRLLECSKPKVFHNWKYDMKFLETIYGYRVNRVIWDTMLGEHYIDEDKKGHYSLKQSTPVYCPNYEGYDDELHRILRSGEDLDDEDEDDIAGAISKMELSDEDLLAYDEKDGCPEDRIDALWEVLVAAIEERNTLKKTQKKNRTAEQQGRFELLKKSIDNYRKQLEVSRPKRKKKEPAEGDADKTKGGGFSDIPLETILQYAAADADVTRIILNAQIQRLQRTGDWEDAKRVMKYLYLPGTRTLSAMEFRGFQQDTVYRDSLIAEVSIRVNDARELFARKFDPTLNLNAPQQIAEYMARLNFASLPGEDPGGTGKDLLDKYESMYPEDDHRHIFAQKLVEFRETTKTLGTYLRPYSKLARADNKIHCTFHLNGTSTGRLSSASPNLQNVPYITARKTKKGDDGKDVVIHPGYNIKKLFVPSKEDYVIVNCDIKGAELRVYTAYSHDELMIEALCNGLDVHSMVTAKVYGLDYEEVNRLKETDPDIKEKRSKCKSTVFATFYGGGPYIVAQQTGSTKEEAEQLQNFLFNEFPALRSYVSGVEHEVRTYQMVSTYFGRKRRFRMAHIDYKHMAEAIREAVNFKIQSTSADVVLSQMCEMDENFDDIGGEMLITVHDSVVFQMPRKNLHMLHDFLDHWIVRRVAEKYDWLPVPFLYDVEVGPSYGEAKPFERKEQHAEKEEATSTG